MSPAQAQTGGQLRLRWSAPAGCPDTGQVEAQVRERLPAVDPKLSVDIEARVTRTRENAYQVHIQLAGAVTGERELEAESCAAAAEATALLIALAIDPSRARAESNLTGNVTPSQAPTVTLDPVVALSPATERTDVAAVTRESEPTREDVARAERNRNDNAGGNDAAEATDAESSDHPLVLRVGVGAGVPLDWGTTPGITSGALLMVSLSLDRVLLVASASWLASRDMTLAPDATLSAGWMSVALDGCYLADATIEWGPCLGADFGQLTSTSKGLADAVDRNELALFASGSLIARARLTGALYAALSVGMRTSVWYPRFVVDGIGDAFQPAAVGLRATFALTLVLG